MASWGGDISLLLQILRAHERLKRFMLHLLEDKRALGFYPYCFCWACFFFLKNANVTPHLAVLWTPPGDEVQGSQSLGLVPLSLPGVRFSSSCLSCVWTPGLPFSFFSDTLSPDLCPLRLANRTQVCSGLRLSLGENLEWIPPPRLTVHFQVVLAPCLSLLEALTFRGAGPVTPEESNAVFPLGPGFH